MPVITTNSDNTVYNAVITSSYTDYDFDSSQSDVTFYNSGSYPINLKIDTIPVRNHIINAGMQLVLNDVEIAGFSAMAPLGDSSLQILSSPFENENPNVAERLNKFGAQLNDIVPQVKQNITFNSDERKPLVSFVDDDISSVVATRLYPLYQAKGIVGSCAVITSKIDVSGYCTTDNLKQFYSNGWEMLGHTYSHNPNLSIYPVDSDLDYQIGEGCLGILKQKGFDVNGFVYPQSVNDLRIRRFTKKYYTYAFANTAINNGNFIDSMRISRIALGAWTSSNPTINGNSEKNTLAYYKACVDSVVANNGWLVFMTHCSDVANGMDETQWQILSDLIDYIKSLNVVIVTPNIAYKSFGNKIFVGDLDDNYFIVNEKGIFQSHLDGSVPVKVIAKNSKLSADGITTYDKNTITVMYTTNPYPTDNSMPETTAGTLFTYYLNTETAYYTFNRQEYWLNGGSTKYIRYATGASSWSAWEKRNNWTTTDLTTYAATYYHTNNTMNAYTAAQLITAYPNYKITTFGVNNAGGTGFPGDAAGTITTYRINGPGWDRQEYRKYLSNELWSRYVDGAGAWTPWVKISAV